MPTSPSDHELPLDELISLSIAETSRRTDWPVSTIRDLINRKVLESYTLGRRRFVVAASLRRVISERTAAPLGRELPPRGKRGRFAAEPGNAATDAAAVAKRDLQSIVKPSPHARRPRT